VPSSSSLSYSVLCDGRECPLAGAPSASRYVDYIVVHELVHLHEPHHTPGFWRRIERAMPDFAARKQWLAENARAAAAI
jgi:predicted metal-dependent hydrolase